MTFHFICVGLSKSQYACWTSKVGMFWFCTSCRLNFEPAVYERDKIMLKALRELLIRTDAMDTRLGNCGENLRKFTKILHGGNQSKSSNCSNLQTTLPQSIDEMTLDDVVDDPINRSRSCDETSFFEVLDEVNSSIAMAPDRFVVRGNKRVQIVESTSRMNASTPAALPHVSKCLPPDTICAPPSRSSPNIHSIGNNTRSPSGRTLKPNNSFLKVANGALQAIDDECYYVTPFTPDQTEDDIKLHVCDITNADPSVVKVTKLVPRGKKLEELSFVSFKISVCRSYSGVVSDSWYWPEGITIRPFEPNSKNEIPARLPKSMQ